MLCTLIVIIRTKLDLNASEYIGIGLPITEEPSHTTGHTIGTSAVRLIRQINFQAGINQNQGDIY